MKFVLEIELGNEAMQTSDDVKAALVQVSEQVDSLVFDLSQCSAHQSRIRDLNGNIVGKWAVQQ